MVLVHVWCNKSVETKEDNLGAVHLKRVLRKMILYQAKFRCGKQEVWRAAAQRQYLSHSVPKAPNIWLLSLTGTYLHCYK
ncbi:hypothetical protein P029_04490 [Anaplasma phagocytophilum str. Norway variant2]|uniref:Uncharacterized protein n=1 Tax=Anaplasma phagocytophilum str. Norway variant2 TaxID=1392507 RepID=A0A161IH66_ANAPH|nr:hypothetical protein P029_04490 [Anaplasma phagocytophilum str. Norway variant2]